MTKTIALPSPHFLLECAMFVQTSFKTNKNLIKYHGLKQLFEAGVFSHVFCSFHGPFPFHWHIVIHGFTNIFLPEMQRWKVTNDIYSCYCNWVAFLCTSIFVIIFLICNFTLTLFTFVWSIVRCYILKHIHYWVKKKKIRSLETTAVNNGQKNKLALKSQERSWRTRQALWCRASWKPDPVILFCWSWTRRKWSEPLAIYSFSIMQCKLCLPCETKLAAYKTSTSPFASM